MRKHYGLTLAKWGLGALLTFNWLLLFILVQVFDLRPGWVGSIAWSGCWLVAVALVYEAMDAHLGRRFDRRLEALGRTLRESSGRGPGAPLLALLMLLCSTAAGAGAVHEISAGCMALPYDSPDEVAHFHCAWELFRRGCDLGDQRSCGGQRELEADLARAGRITPEAARRLFDQVAVRGGLPARHAAPDIGAPDAQRGSLPALQGHPEWIDADAPTRITFDSTDCRKLGEVALSEDRPDEAGYYCVRADGPRATLCLVRGFLREWKYRGLWLLGWALALLGSIVYHLAAPRRRGAA